MADKVEQRLTPQQGKIAKQLFKANVAFNRAPVWIAIREAGELGDARTAARQAGIEPYTEAVIESSARRKSKQADGQ